jgi:uncharacterized membrane protein YfcA
MDFSYSLAGLFVGTIVGLTGVGGGSLMTPLLVLLFGISPATAIGTDLLYASITKAGGAAVHGIKKSVDWRVVGWLALGSVPASVIALIALSGQQHATTDGDSILKAALGVMLLATAIALVYRKPLQAWAASRGRTREGELRTTEISANPVTTVLVGAGIGAAVSLSSVGAGAVGVTALMLLYPLMATKKVVGTDIAHAVPLTLVAGLGHATLGNVDWILLVSLLVGSLPGVVIGSLLTSRLPEPVIRNILVALLVTVGGRMLWVR